jgi:hypothetical protein
MLRQKRENDSHCDGKNIPHDFLLALPLRANSIHAQLLTLDLESHTPPTARIQASRKHGPGRREEGSKQIASEMIPDRLGLPHSPSPHLLSPFGFDLQH